MTLVALAVIGLPTIALIGRYVWFPNYRPGLDAGQTYGIDVSHHQGEIDWEQVADDEIEFAYIKSTEGGDWVDPKFVENWNNAVDANIKVGAYHFFTLCRDGETQAKNFLNTVSKVEEQGDGLPLAVDIELGGNCADPPSNDVIEQELEIFLEIVEAEKNEASVLYILEGFDFLDSEILDRPRWRRSILLKPSESDWFVWQFSGKSRVDGIEGDVDLNVYRN